MEIPVISILMPVYNAELFLNDTIESVLNQTFKSFELIIIDDVSTDRSIDIIRSYSDPRIKLFQNQKNIGTIATLCKGIDLCQAEYIARLDHDDICYPNRLERQYEFIKSNPDGALYSCWAKEVTKDRDFVRTDMHDPAHYYFNLTFTNWIYHSTMVYRKDAVLSVGKYTAAYTEDFELIWQILRRYKIYHQPEVLLEYRHTDQSLWQCIRKEECKTDFLSQVRRNILFYMDDHSIPLEDWQLELLSHSYGPKDQFTIDQVKSSLQLLEDITRKIIHKESVNMISSDVLNAFKEKRDYILKTFYRKFGYFKGLALLVRTNSWGLIAELVMGGLANKMISLITGKNHRSSHSCTGRVSPKEAAADQVLESVM
jgi:glycosyltransferase involved in cell wall biosynthesis